MDHRGIALREKITKTEVDENYIAQLLGFDAPKSESEPTFIETEEVENYARALIRTCVSLDEIPCPPFCIQNDYQARSNLIVLTQFFLAEVNVYCYAHGLSTINFGTVIDADPTLSQEIPLLVKTALKDDQSVERVLLDYINKNRAKFGLSRELSDTAFQEINALFAADYNSVKNTYHLDEFGIVVDMPGKFKLHRDKICIDFAEIAGAVFPYLDNAHFRKAQEAAQGNSSIRGK